MIGRVYLERGEPVTVVCRWAGPGPRNVLIERADGSRVVRPFRGLRRAQLTIDDVLELEEHERMGAPTS